MHLTCPSCGIELEAPTTTNDHIAGAVRNLLDSYPELLGTREVSAEDVVGDFLALVLPHVQKEPAR